MPNIVVCYKWVLDESGIQVKSDLTVDLSGAESKISADDRNAIEAAVRAAKSINGQAIGLTFGTENAQKSLKDALSRGLNSACWVQSAHAAAADGKGTAKALAAAIQTTGDVSLVICSDGASDTLARQTAPRIGAVLGWPVITAVRSLRLSEKELTVVKKLENCMETIQVELPAVISVLPEINPAPLPSLMQIMGAAKKPVKTLDDTALSLDFTTNTEITECKGYVMDRKNVLLKDGEANETIQHLITALKKEGVL